MPSFVSIKWLSCLVRLKPWLLARPLDILPPISFNPHTQPRYSPTADPAFSSREENSQPAQESPPSCQQSAAILSIYVISLELRTYHPIMQAETQRNAWTLVAKFANSSLNSKILSFTASPLVMSFKALSRCPSQAVLSRRLPSLSALTSGEHTLTLAKAHDLPRKLPKLLIWNATLKMS